MDLNKKVLLLAIYKKEKDESLKDVILKLENTRVFTYKEGKKLLKELKKEKYINENELSVKGIILAKKIEEEFKI